MTKRKVTVRIFFGSLLVVLCFFFLKNIETIQAKPDDGNPIVIDKGTADEFSLPFDAQTLLEPELLLESPLYDDYFQEDMKHLAFQKSPIGLDYAQTTLWSSEIMNEIVNSFITPTGNVISLQKFTTFPYGEGYSKISAHKLILQSSSGKVLDQHWISQSPKDIHVSTEGTSTYTAKLLEWSGNEYMVLYNTVDEPTMFYDGENAAYFDLSGEKYVEENNQLKLVSAEIPRIYSEANPLDQYLSTHVAMEDGNIFSIGTKYNSSTMYGGSVFNENERTHALFMMETPYYKFDYSFIKNDSFLFYSEPSSPIEKGFIAVEEQKRSNGTYNSLRSWRYQYHATLPYMYVIPSQRDEIPANNEIISFKDREIIFEKDISNEQHYYFQVKGDKLTDVEFYKLNTIDMSIEKVKTFPPGTNIKLRKLPKSSEFAFVGQIKYCQGVFEAINTGEGMYTGILDSDFNLLSSGKTDLNFVYNEGEVILNNFLFDEKNSNYVLSGFITDEENQFIDKVIYGNYPNEIIGQNQEWVEQSLSPIKGNGFVSFLSLVDDWAPIIKPPESFLFDINDSDVIAANYSIIDNWLLTGSKDGAFDDLSAVKVFDNFDQKLGLVHYSQEWINKRINRNPLNLANPIDWAALGLDLNSVGPQQITYFISDSANQVTTTSQWINKKDDFTALDDDHALYAKNFSVPLASVQTDLSSIDEVKKRAETKAWNLTNFEFKEDGTKNLFSDKVLIDEAQLSSLQQAKDAKPYPLDITYQTENGKITRRIWVFVTAENTTVDTENNIVLYANDYRYPLDQAPTTTVEKQLRAQWDNTEPAVKAYEYNAIQETGQTLIPLSDGTLEGTSGGLGMEQLDLERIQEATEPSVLADIHFTYTIGEKKVSVAVDVTLYHAQTSVVVNFEDTDQTVVHPQVIIVGHVNSQIDLTSKEVVTDALSEIIAEGYLLKERPENETDILLTAEKKEVTYIFEGQLQFIQVTDSLKLTKGKILPFAQTLKYDNPAEDFTVQVKDTRSYKNQTEKTRGTFKVNVSLTKEFESIDGKKLSEAALLYKNQEITDSGLDVTRSKQNPLNPEEKDFSFLLNQKGTGTEGFTLEVPAGIAQTKAYYAEMTWDLIEGP